jgi:hypothetical protein
MNTEPPNNSTHRKARPRGGSQPGERRGGRKAGTPNTITRDLRAAIIGAFEAKGGQAYLERIADEDPRVFCSLLAKLVPTVLEGNPEAPITIETLARDALNMVASTCGLPSDHQLNRK